MSILVLGGCNAVRLSGSTPSTLGYVAGDEPRAVGVARDILAHGGNAADAAAALGLTLVATLPSRAGLGGGGACLVHTGRDIPSYTGILSPGTSNIAATPTQSLDFMPRAARAGSGIGVPALPRGLSALQAKYGSLRWQQIVAPAENIARFGMPLSRALARDLARAPGEVTGPGGRPLAEGEPMVQSDLANSLDLLRSRGAGDFYLGRSAAAIVEGSNGELDAETLRSTMPKWESPKGVPFGNDTVYFTPNPGGVFAEKLWRTVRTGPESTLYAKLLNIVGDAKPDTGDSAQRAFAVADAAAPVLAAGPGGEPASDRDAATSFIVVDGHGLAVACTVTMGRLFGAGRRFGATGIRASTPVPGPESEGISGAAMIVANESVSKFLAAIAAGGDRSGPEAMVQVALGTLVAREPVPDAMAVARLYAAAPGILYAEPGLKLGQRSATSVPALGAVNAIVCPGGLPAEKPDCSAQSDPRSAGQIGAINTQRPSDNGSDFKINNNAPPKLQ